MKKRLITDCQLLQTSDRNRGMGLYLVSMLSSMEKSYPSDLEFKFILNSELPDLNNEDTNLLKSLGEVLNVKLLSKKNKNFFAEASEYNRRAIDSLSIFDGKYKNIFYIPALFSSEIFPVFPSSHTSNLLQFHDIIPFLYQDHYFKDPLGLTLKDYGQRWREGYRTDLFTTDSQTTADDLTIYFGIDPSRIVPVYGADAHRDNPDIQKPKIKGLTNKYVLMPSGDDFRKNNEMAARGFANLNSDVQLVITSNFGDETKKLIKDIYPNVLFTGSVSSGELLWLIDKAKFVFFPSEYEGLGMPILEAVNRGSLVACSDIPVFKEISAEAFSFFDPKSEADIARALKDMMNDRTNKDHLAKEYNKIKEFFSWQRTADRLIKSLDKIEPAPPKQKLAVFCPSPSSYSAVGKFVFEVHGELSRYFDIDYYFEKGQTEFKPTRPNILDGAASYKPVSEFKFNNNDYDCVLYHIGNSEFHAETILNSLRFSANAIVHDSWLNGVFDYMERYKYLTTDRRKLESIIDDKLKTKSSKDLVSIVTNQKALFCHSDYVKKALNEISSNLNVEQTCLPVGVPVGLTIHEGFNISFAGLVQESKGISLVGKVAGIDDVRVKVFGFGALGDSPLLNELPINVEVLYDLSDKDFQDYLRESDILINYRLNYHGETSLSTLEAMRFGVVVIVNNVGWFAELPDDCVVKVTSEDELIKAVSELKDNPNERQRMGQAAKKFLTKEYSFGRYAKILAGKLEDRK